ncbi:MAG TPA: Rieske 2Fe-2S domain-containing protein [Solirubrobacteraceae bacterium]|jgi:nitrite reductase (NADH) small subunit|nr:Rieske 2Fe-2S domain-containing protein [Solirubrobacteraceae bacterium]
MAGEYAICKLRELPDGHHRVVRVGGRELGVFNIRGSFHALPNLCPHQRGPLCEGGVSGTIDYGPHTDFKLAWIWEGEVVTCPWHSLEFHIPTGRCIAFDDIRLRTYEVRVVGDELRVVI